MIHAKLWLFNHDIAKTLRSALEAKECDQLVIEPYRTFNQDA